MRRHSAELVDIVLARPEFRTSLSILDTIAPRRGPKRRRLTKSLVAKTGFYVFVAGAAVFMLASVILFENDRTLEQVPSTRDSFAVIDEVQLFLQIATHRGFLNNDEPASCWDVFEKQSSGLNTCFTARGESTRITSACATSGESTTRPWQSPGTTGLKHTARPSIAESVACDVCVRTSALGWACR